VATSTTRQTMALEHPYKLAGGVTIIASLILIAFDLGFLVSCGAGHGICVDFTTHRTGTAALIVFFIAFIIGVVLIVYTGASTTLTTQTTRVPPAAPPPSPPPTGHHRDSARVLASRCDHRQPHSASALQYVN
jgi:hypothetical protein